MLFLETFRKSWHKRWTRITQSNATKCFVITSLLQAITLIILQLRMFLRNTSLSDQMEAYIEQNRTLATSCEMGLAETRLTLLFAENFCFIFFQIVQVIHQNMIQIFMILGLNIASSLYGIVQQSELENELDIISTDCPGVYRLSPNYEQYEYPNIIISLVFVTVNIILTWRLFILFEQKMNKKFEEEQNSRALYRRMLVFVMMLKLDAFLVVINTSLTAAIIPFLGKQSMMFIIIYIIHSTILLLSFFAVILAFNSDGVSAASSGWYFWIFIIAITLIAALITYYYACLIVANFGSGLKAMIDNELQKEEVNSFLEIIKHDT
ncbi:6758_t:CDS:2, partial [Scutellospora calospora]